MEIILVCLIVVLAILLAVSLYFNYLVREANQQLKEQESQLTLRLYSAEVELNRYKLQAKDKLRYLDLPQ